MSSTDSDPIDTIRDLVLTEAAVDLRKRCPVHGNYEYVFLTCQCAAASQLMVSRHNWKSDPDEGAAG